MVFFEHTLEHTRFCQSLHPSISNGYSVSNIGVRVPCPPPSMKKRPNASFFMLNEDQRQMEIREQIFLLIRLYMEYIPQKISGAVIKPFF